MGIPPTSKNKRRPIPSVPYPLERQTLQQPQTHLVTSHSYISQSCRKVPDDQISDVNHYSLGKTLSTAREELLAHTRKKHGGSAAQDSSSGQVKVKSQVTEQSRSPRTIEPSQLLVHATGRIHTTFPIHHRLGRACPLGGDSRDWRNNHICTTHAKPVSQQKEPPRPPPHPLNRG